MHKFDRIDRMILGALQENARISNVDLANQVGLSQSACLRRVNMLEQEGVIEGYQAVISNHAIGQAITAIIQITLDGQAKQQLSAFEQAVEKCPFIVACFLMSGESDYIIRVNARDMNHFSEIHKNWLSALPGVLRLESNFALRVVVNRANIDVAKSQ